MVCPTHLPSITYANKATIRHPVIWPHLSPLGWEHINLTGDRLWKHRPPSVQISSGLSASALTTRHRRLVCSKFCFVSLLQPLPKSLDQLRRTSESSATISIQVAGTTQVLTFVAKVRSVFASGVEISDEFQIPDLPRVERLSDLRRAAVFVSGAVDDHRQRLH